MNKTVSKYFLLGILVLATVTASAQDLVEQANQSYQAKEWKAAAKAYRTLSQNDTSQAQYHYRLGVAQRHLGKYQAAVNALETARRAGFPGMFVDLEMARLFVQRKEPEMALEKLKLAGEQGYGNVGQVEQDPELSVLAESEAFNEAMDPIKRNSAPCEYVDHASDFDFWLGEWDVYDKNRTIKYGENSVSRENRGCYLQEQWLSATGNPGSSMNYYDPGQQRWRQHWVGSGGSIIDIYGGLVNGSMVLTGRLYDIKKGSEKPFRGTWTPQPDGRVRQFFEQSDDNGKSWVPWFDGYYERKAESQ